MKKKQLAWITAALHTTLLMSTASAVVVGFDGGTATLRDGTVMVTSNIDGTWDVENYEENGVLVQFNGLTDSFGSYIGKYYFDGEFYGHEEGAVIHTHWGSLQSVTFSMKDGSAFELNYMDVTTNTGSNSWVTASNGATMLIPYSDWGFIDGMERVWFTPDFDSITSFTVTSNDAFCFGLDNFYINEPAPPNPDDPDTDEDGIVDSDDNCLMTPNPNQSDADSDGIGNVCDTCPYDPDNDIDADGICASLCGEVDNCPDVANPDQSDADSDGIGNVCDDDDDNDGVLDVTDNCQYDPNPDQTDTDQDGTGDVCDTDSDGDGVLDGEDECLGTDTNDVINSSGCSVDQLCPCDNSWKNHGGYVKCVAHTAKDFLTDGLITVEQKQDYVSSAARSKCGHKKPKRNLTGKKVGKNKAPKKNGK